MSTATATHDVFMSTTATDRAQADVVQRAIESQGLSVFRADHVAVGDDWPTELREAIGDCPVFLLILSQVSLNSAWSVMELGAAQAWGKAIFVVSAGVTEVPPFLRPFEIVPISQLSSLVSKIQQSIRPLTDAQLKALLEAYERVGVPSDQLAARPSALDRLTKQFNRKVGAHYSQERLLQDLVRARKRGSLPRISRRTG